MRNCSNDPPCYVGVSGTAGLLNPSLDSPGVEISYLSLPGTEAPQHDPPLHRSDPGQPRPPPQFYLKIVFLLISFFTRITVKGNAIKRGELF